MFALILTSAVSSFQLEDVGPQATSRGKKNRTPKKCEDPRAEPIYIILRSTPQLPDPRHGRLQNGMSQSAVEQGNHRRIVAEALWLLRGRVAVAQTLPIIRRTVPGSSRVQAIDDEGETPANPGICPLSKRCRRQRGGRVLIAHS